MKLKELLSITAMDQIVNVISYKNREKINIETIKYKNDYGKIESWKYDKFIEQYGDNNVKCQYIENNSLTVVIELSK